MKQQPEHHDIVAIVTNPVVAKYKQGDEE